MPKRPDMVGNKFAVGNNPNQTSFKKGLIPWNKKDIKLYCHYCGKEIYPRDRLSRVYCSNRCTNLDKKGKHNSPNTEFKKGYTPWNKDKYIRKQCLVCGVIFRANSDARKFCSKDCFGKASGSKNHYNWQNGKSFEPYGLEFNKYLKKLVRQRDNFICQECDYTEKQLGYKLHIHHIDYDKTNNNLDNLISLCRSCHLKTNFERKDWIKYFKNKDGK